MAGNHFGRATAGGGWGGIRTHGSVATTPVFKTGALNRSATHPYLSTVPQRHAGDAGLTRGILPLAPSGPSAAPMLAPASCLRAQDRCLKPLGHPSGYSCRNAPFGPARLRAPSPLPAAGERVGVRRLFQPRQQRVTATSPFAPHLAFPQVRQAQRRARIVHACGRVVSPHGRICENARLPPASHRARPCPERAVPSSSSSLNSTSPT